MQEEELENSLIKLKRNIFIGFLVLFIILFALLIFYFLSASLSSSSSVKQTQVTEVKSSQDDSEEEQSNDSSAKKTVTIPDASSLIGTSIDTSIEQIGHGAQVLSDVESSGSKEAVVRVVKFTLASDEGDSKTGNPTLMAEVDKDGAILAVTYVASLKSLGYGNLSFRDAVVNEKVISKVMREAGVEINEDDVILPTDKTEYSIFTSDSSRVSKEQRDFSGVGKRTSGDQSPMLWSSTLTYDYSVSLETDNLADTLRMISIYVAQK